MKNFKMENLFPNKEKKNLANQGERDYKRTEVRAITYIKQDQAKKSTYLS